MAPSAIVVWWVQFRPNSCRSTRTNRSRAFKGRPESQTQISGARRSRRSTDHPLSVIRFLTV